MTESPPWTNRLGLRLFGRMSCGGAAWAFIAILSCMDVRGAEPADAAAADALDAAIESHVIDPNFTAELFRDSPESQKTLPDEEEAVAGDGGKMPAVAAEEAEKASGDAAEGVAAPADASLSPELQELRSKVRETLGSYFRRHLNTRDHTPWEVFHQVIAFGSDTLVRRGGPKGKTVDAVRWLCDNQPSHGMQLMHLERDQMALRRGKGVQGHAGQFLAILAQRNVARDYPIEVGGRKFTVEDLILTEQRTCVTGEELTFKLIAFSHYLEPDARWKNDRGEIWTVERVLREEIGAPIRGAACGGTHRLMGLSYAVQRRQRLDQPMDGEYKRAESYLRDYHRYAFSLQNEDGSFSTEWFAGRGNRDLKDRKLQTTGHITEWLAYSLADKHLADPRMVKAMGFLTTLLHDDRKAEWAIGPMCHALHALALYDERVFVAAETTLAARPKPDTAVEVKSREAATKAESE